MAKKKPKDIAEDTVQKSIIKEFGDSIFMGGDAVIAKPKIIIPVSPAIDNITGGGIPVGSFVIVTGKKKLGKTTLCLQYAANYQKKDYATEKYPNGRKVYFFNVEGRLERRDLEGIHGLQTSADMFQVIGSARDKILSAEDYLDILLKLISAEDDCLFIMDSVSQLCSNKYRELDSIGNKGRDDVPGMLSLLTKHLCNILPVRNNTLMCITHIVANTSGMGMKTTSEVSGEKIQYQSTTKLEARYQKPYKDGEKQIGQLVNWRCPWSSIGLPNGECNSLLRYGYGLDEEYEMFQLAADVGIIEKKGAWFKVGEQSLQGAEKVTAYLRENRDVYDNIKKEIYEVLF